MVQLRWEENRSWSGAGGEREGVAGGGGDAPWLFRSLARPLCRNGSPRGTRVRHRPPGVAAALGKRTVAAAGCCAGGTAAGPTPGSRSTCTPSPGSFSDTPTWPAPGPGCPAQALPRHPRI